MVSLGCRTKEMAPRVRQHPGARTTATKGGTVDELRIAHPAHALTREVSGVARPKIHHTLSQCLLRLRDKADAAALDVLKACRWRVRDEQLLGLCDFLAALRGGWACFNCCGLSLMWGMRPKEHTTSCGSGNSLFTGVGVGDILLPPLQGRAGIHRSFPPALIRCSEYLSTT